MEGEHKMTTYENGRDNGKQGKKLRSRSRRFITPRTRAQYCKSMRMVDHFIKLDGKRVNIEIKSGAGNAWITIGTLDISIPAIDHIPNVYPKTDFVVYTPKWEGEDVGENAWVMTRVQFIEMLEGYKGMVKYNRKGDTTVLQMQVLLKQQKRENYLWDCLAEVPTLAEWRSQHRLTRQG